MEDESTVKESMVFVRLALIALFLMSCGRVDVGQLKNQNATQNSIDASQSGNSDADLMPPNPDSGLPECREDRDCPVVRDRACSDGAIEEWTCERGRCELTCEPPPPQNCQNDCQCPPGLVCGNNECVLADRPNLCCAYDECIPGGPCVWANGIEDICPERRRDGGLPPQDGGGQPPSNPDAGPTNPPRDAGTSGATCNNDCDCAYSLACISGQCRAANRLNQCCSNPQCPPGSGCVNQDGSSGMCPSGVPVGNACTQHLQCTLAGICIEERYGFPDGYCSQYCGAQGMPCTGDAICRQVGNDELCLDGCITSGDCRMGYVCTQFALSMSRVCWPQGPTSMNPQGAPVGGACQQDNDCGSGLTCVQQQGQSWQGGYCTVQSCDPATNPCPTMSQCYAFPSWFPICLAECPVSGTQSNCRNGYYCLGPAGQPGVCITQ